MEGGTNSPKKTYALGVYAELEQASHPKARQSISVVLGIWLEVLAGIIYHLALLHLLVGLCRGLTSKIASQSADIPVTVSSSVVPRVNVTMVQEKFHAVRCFPSKRSHPLVCQFTHSADLRRTVFATVRDKVREFRIYNYLDPNGLFETVTPLLCRGYLSSIFHVPLAAHAGHFARRVP